MRDKIKKGLIFDMDGTLWNATENITKSWNYILKKENVNIKLTLDDMKAVMGKTMTDIADTLFYMFDSDKRMDLLKNCCDYENEYLREHGGELYPELESTLKELQKDYHLYIVSNCQSGYIEAFLEYYGFQDLFEDIECFGNNRQLKADNIRLVCERNQLDIAYYIGDIQGDYDATKEAGLAFIHARYGFGTVAQPVSYINNFIELPDLMSKLSARKYKLAIFDMDGTILDTLTDINKAVNATLEKYSLPVKDIEHTKYAVGNGLKLTLKRSLPVDNNISDVQFGEMFDYMLQYYAKHSNDNTKPYEGIRELLYSLKENGYLTAVVSNKRHLAVLNLMNLYYMNLFDIGVGEEENRRPKPYPDSIEYVLRELNVSKEDAVYIGDSEVDLETAKNSDLDCIAVTWGFRDKKFLIEKGATVLASTPDAVLALLGVTVSNK